jgi:CHAT domain-containing protein
MRVAIIIGAVFLSISSFGQMIDNRIFKKIRKESYSDALAYGEKKLVKLKRGQKYNEKAIPYLLGLGMVYKKMGNYSDAERNYTEARKILEIKDKNNSRKKIIDYDVLDELGLMYLSNGNFYEAEEIIKQSIKDREQRFDKTNLLRYRSYLVYGNYFFHTHQPDSAYKYYKKYIYYVKNSRHTSKEELNRYADTYKFLAEMELERKNATQALVFARKNKHLQFHNWTKKEAGSNTLNKVIAHNLLSQSYKELGKIKQAERASLKAFHLYNKKLSASTYDLVPLLMNRGFINWNKGEYSLAETDFVKASEIQSDFIDKNFRSLSEYEKENFYGALKESFDILNSFALAKRTKNPEAEDSLWNTIYNFHIKTKAILLNESNRMLEVIQNSKDKELVHQFNEWRKLKNELSKKMLLEGLGENDPSIREIKYAVNNLEKLMSAKTAIFNGAERSITWKDVQDKLSVEEAAVEVLRVRRYGVVDLNNTKYKRFKNVPTKTKDLTDTIAYVFLVVTPQVKSPEVVIINSGNLLENKNYRYYLNTKLYKIEDKSSYITYWKPLESKLSGVKNIYFSSDGVYNLINLWILKNPETGKYLIDEKRIINITNTRQVISLNKEKITLNSVLLLGRPNYAMRDSLDITNKDTDLNRAVSRFFRSGVNDLPGTEEEVTKIADYLAENKIENKVLLWDNATEELLKEADSKHVIHIATHGFFDTDIQGRNPMMRSGLLLAGVSKIGNNSKEDGILTAYEASNLDLNNTSLVVLSACETGLGEIKSGEGVYGLQRAFEVAGVNAILMSMWKVNDQTTQELMVLFYQELIRTKSVPDSFRNAQLKIREKYSEPLYWGAFKLIGY